MEIWVNFVVNKTCLNNSVAAFSKSSEVDGGLENVKKKKNSFSLFSIIKLSQSNSISKLILKVIIYKVFDPNYSLYL